MRTLTLLCTLALVAGPALAGDLPATHPSTRPAEPSAAAFPTFGVSFSLPGGWLEIPREKAGRIGQWIGPDSKPAAMKQLIMIETGRPGAVSAQQMARGLARNFGGVVMDEQTTLGGEPALVVRADNHDDELAPIFGLVCIHGDNVFLVMGGEVKDRDVRDEIEIVRKSWKWTPIEKPARHLELREKPFEAFDGKVKLNVPKLMHSVAADDPDTQLDLAMYNLSRNNADFRATLTLATLKPDESFDDARARFLASLGDSFKFKKPPAWQEVKGAVTARTLTATVEADRPQPAETDTLHHQWAAVSLGADSGRVLLIHFTHEAETVEERQEYEKAVSAIVESIAAK